MSTRPFNCTTLESTRCDGDVYRFCVQSREFIIPDQEDCSVSNQICVSDLGCKTCEPATDFCDGQQVRRCDAEGDSSSLVEECNPLEGETCSNGRCIDACDAVADQPSYVGCEFFAADLDNAAIDVSRNASSQQYAVVVSNVNDTAASVRVERIYDPVGASSQTPVIMSETTVPPNGIGVLELPRNEVDGASSLAACNLSDAPCLDPMETCVCPDGIGCRCVVDPSKPVFEQGVNDGTHSALTARGYRIVASRPIIAYQFNPLENVSVFSNDASMLIPTNALGSRYTVVAWPQTIADADCNPEEASCAAIDFNPNVDDEDLRATLTIIGTVEQTRVKITMGSAVGETLEGGGIPAIEGGGSFETTIGPFEVLNIESDGLDTDFTGTVVDADNPVAVFVGSEASDAPRFSDYAQRQCCADHLEEQLFPDSTLGSSFVIGKMPTRTQALTDAFVDPNRESVAVTEEREWVRILAVNPGTTIVRTTLPSPFDHIELQQGESRILETKQNFILASDGGKPLSVLQVIGSQETVGIPAAYPGGDPAIVAVPPADQFRRSYTILTPDKYLFDFLVLSAPVEATLRIDNQSPEAFGCSLSRADGKPMRADLPPSSFVVYRCPLSAPEVQLDCADSPEVCQVRQDPENPGGGNMRRGISNGIQNDGVHQLQGDMPFGVIVYGFDSFVSYAYAGGLDLDPIVR